MIIKNASVFQEDGTFKTQDIYIEGDKIAENGSGDVLDADGLIAIPGLTDIHFHGCMRNDFCDRGCHHHLPRYDDFQRGDPLRHHEGCCFL